MILSIIIPVYNTIEYLPFCLKSIEKQDFSDMEIILVDDGSTDGCSEFCDEYAARHSSVTVIHKSNGGAAESRNVGLLSAKGDYIHFIDSDDFLLPNHTYKEFFDVIYHEHPDIVLSRFAEYSPDLKELVETQIEYKKNGVFDGNVLKEVLVNRYPATLTSPVNKLFSRRLLLKNDLFFTKGIDHEEDEWLPRVLACSKRVWFYNQVIYGVRKGREGSLSETLDEATLARKSCSKIHIAYLGETYMEGKDLPPDTLMLITEYYWDYLIDACVAYNHIASKQYQANIIQSLKDHRAFLNSFKYLKSINRRILGVMFKALGIKTTVRIIGLRYGK